MCFGIFQEDQGQVIAVLAGKFHPPTFFGLRDVAADHGITNHAAYNAVVDLAGFLNIGIRILQAKKSRGQFCAEATLVEP